jgi:Zn-dependent protease
MWVSFAGPLSNLLLAILAAIPFRLGLLSIGYAFIPNDNILPTQEQFLFEFITINLLLMLFNLIPIAPLDGEKILAYLLPPSIARSYETLRPYGPLLLMVVIFVLPFVGIDILGMILYPVMQVILTFLLGI